MPELPEVESARSHIHRVGAGHRIVRVVFKEQGGGPRDGLVDDIILEIPSENNLPPSTSASSKPRKNGGEPSVMDVRERIFSDALLNKTVEAVFRKGKQLWMTFQDTECPAVLFHFGMTGSVLIKNEVIPSYKSFKVLPGEEAPWPPRFTKCEIEFDNGACIAFCDPRRLGRIKLRRDPLMSEPINELGIDPLTEELPTAAELEKRLQCFSAPIKALLLDQNKVFCGIGNYLADEILYQAGIYPETKACRINRLGLQRMLEKMKAIISTAVACDARYEDFPREWLFHYRWDKVKSKSERIRMPDGSILVFETCGGRTSAIVPSKQPRSGDYTKTVQEEEEDENADLVEESITVPTKKRKGSPVGKVEKAEEVIKHPRSRGAKKELEVKEEPVVKEEPAEKEERESNIAQRSSRRRRA